MTGKKVYIKTLLSLKLMSLNKIKENLRAELYDFFSIIYNLVDNMSLLLIASFSC